MRLINADALIQSLEKKHAHWHELVSEENKDIEFAHSYALNVIRNAPTADAKPAVIRSKTLMPTKDFMEWAKRIKELNPNVVVISCDAEVASADAVQVVLCKNCRFYDNLCEVCRCPQWDLSRTEYPKVKENDFCSYWEASDED